MRIGYGRVSSRGQSRDGNSLDAQKEQLEAVGCEEIVLETFTGTRMERPKLDKVLAKLQPGDELIVCKLDRFARTAAEGSAMVQELVNRGVIVNILNMGRADNTPMGKLMVTIMLAFAEYERDMIVERTSEGKAIAKIKNPNYREGRKPREIPSGFNEYRNYVKRGMMTVTAACEELEISRTMWYKWVKTAPENKYF